MIQDENGYLWVATEDGLCRFDGQEFKLYNTDEGLKRHEVYSVIEGDSGDIWVCTRGGISKLNDYKPFNNTLDSLPIFSLKIDFDHCFYDKSSSLFYAFDEKLPNIKLYKFDNTNSILSDIVDNCVLQKVKIDSTDYIVIRSLDSESLLSVTNQDTLIIKSITKHITNIFEYNEKVNFLIDGAVFELSNNQLISSTIPFLNSFSKTIKTIKVVGDDIYFISGNKLYFFNGLLLTEIINETDFGTLNYLFSDRENNIWTCTSNGIVKINPTPFNGFDKTNNLQGIATNIERDNNGRLWVSTIEGLFYKLDSSTNFHKVLNARITDFIILNNDSIIYSSIISKQNAFLGLYVHKLKSSKKLVIKSDLIALNTLERVRSILTKSVFSFTRDTENNILMTGTYNDLIIKMDNNLNLITFYDEKRIGKEGWIPSLFCHSNGDLWFRSSVGLKRIRNSKVEKFKLKYNGFYSFIEDKKGNLIGISDVGLTYIYLENGNFKNYQHFTNKNGLSEKTIFTLAALNDKDLLLGTSRGLNKVIDFSDSLDVNKFKVKFFDKKDGLIGIDFYVNASFVDVDSSVWMGTSEGLMHYLPKKDISNSIQPNLFLEEIKYQNTSQDSWDIINGKYDDIKQVINPFFHHYQNDLTFDVKAISISTPNMLKYSYFLEGAEVNWSEPTVASFSRYNNLDPGEYVFKCKAIRTSDGVESGIITYTFKIDAPYYAKPWFYITIIFGLGFLIYSFIYFREKQLKLINESLERKVKFRTTQLNKEKKTVEKQNELITKSISYAKRIQYSILPENKLMDDFFSDHLIHYQPKDIVGGDFYWFRSFGDIAIIAAVDCTGHGVPGGFMSMMGSLLLDKIVQQNNLNTSDILADLNLEIIRVLRQENEDSMQDGMDLSICLVNKKSGEVHFSGARNGIYLIDNESSKHYDADLIPVGGFHSKKSKPGKRTYTQQKFNVSKDNWVFMYTDGYVDQLGGNQMRSMGMNLFLEAIQETVVLKTNKSREEVLKKKYDDWRNKFPPIDDVLVIGFKI